MAVHNPPPPPVQGPGPLPINQPPPLQIPPRPGLPIPQQRQPPHAPVQGNPQVFPIEIPPDGNLGTLINPSFFKVVIMRCTAGVHEGSATVTLDRWQGPWKMLPNEFVASALNAASNCPIQHLILKQHRLDSLPHNFASLEAQLPASLVTLDLSFNKFESLPSVVCQLVQLNNLHLNNNQITQLPEEMSNLKQLRILHLQHNKLEALPVSCCYLESLETLNVKENVIKTVPEEIHHLKHLRTLYAGSNQIESLPCTFVQLPLLEVAHLTDNQLKSLPCSLQELKSLKQLYLANNQLRFLPLSFIKLNLEGFTISGNNLKFPPLSACRNGVKSLQDYMFKEYCNSSIEAEIDGIEVSVSCNLYFDDSSDSGEETPYEELDD